MQFLKYILKTADSLAVIASTNVCFHKVTPKLLYLIVQGENERHQGNGGIPFSFEF